MFNVPFGAWAPRLAAAVQWGEAMSPALPRGPSFTELGFPLTEFGFFFPSENHPAILPSMETDGGEARVYTYRGFIVEPKTGGQCDLQSAKAHIRLRVYGTGGQAEIWLSRFEAMALQTALRELSAGMSEEESDGNP